MDSSASRLAREKLVQAITLLQRYDLDLWLSFVRENSLRKDPALDLILPFDVTWQSAFLVSRSGESIAIAGRYDAANLERLQAYSQVIAYDQSIRPALVEALQRVRPQTVAVNFSRNDPAADGLTHGLWLVLEEIFAQADIPPGQILSAEAFLGSLRGQKTALEIEAIRGAVAATEALLHEVTERIRPGVTERELAAFLHARMTEGNLAPAWDLASNPIVNTGPDSEVGHAVPTDLAVQPGHLVHLDFGVKRNGYCADLQRMWYVLETREESPPAEVVQVWDSVRGALLAGAAALKPGARGWEVDKAARSYLMAQGLPEYLHAFGHHVGRAAHDGATILGPRWERYGQTPYGLVEAGNVFAIELGAPVPGRGSVYLEENVLVTEQGVEWLSEAQTELHLIRG